MVKLWFIEMFWSRTALPLDAAASTLSVGISAG